MLQCVKPKVCEFRYFLTWRPDTKNATSVLGSDVFREEVVVEETITEGHAHSLRQLPLLDLPASNSRGNFLKHEVTANGCNPVGQRNQLKIPGNNGRHGSKYFNLVSDKIEPINSSEVGRAHPTESLIAVN